MRPVSILPSPEAPSEPDNKNETCAKAHKKRIARAKRKIKAVTREHRRIARERGLYAVILTLNYQEASGFSSKHLKKFLDRLRIELKRKNHSLPYIWVMERAGKLHYHLLLWFPRGFKLSVDNLEIWWPWGITSIERCRSVAAWCKYISKAQTKSTIPASAKLFGCGGLDDAGKGSVRRQMVPRWLDALLPWDALPHRISKLGWVDLNTGAIYACTWMWTPHGMRLKPKVHMAVDATKDES